MRLGWLTDPHFNFVKLIAWEQLTRDIGYKLLDALIISGDISEAEDVVWQLERLSCETNLPIYYVLGNHDFYHGSIAGVRASVKELQQRSSSIHYLTGGEPIRLNEQWQLCGEDGWADARIGDYYRSPIRMNDFRLISDLESLTSEKRLKILRREGAAAALRLRTQLRVAAERGDSILVVTHIPPFRESCWYEKKHSDDDWAPFFTCFAVGWVLEHFCKAHPDKQVLVLCGHTHHAGKSQILPNLFTWTGAAEYGAPRLSEVLDLANLATDSVDYQRPT